MKLPYIVISGMRQTGKKKAYAMLNKIYNKNNEETKMKYIHFVESIKIVKGQTEIQFSNKRVMQLFIKTYKSKYTILGLVNTEHISNWEFHACRSTTEERENIMEQLNEEFTLEDNVSIDEENNKNKA